MSALTQKTSGRALMLAVAILLIASFAFFGPPSQATEPVYGDLGVIVLSTGPEPEDNKLEYYDNPDFTAGGSGLGTVAYTELITTVRCEASPGTTVLVMDQDPDGRGLGLVSNGFGTRDKNNCSTGNGQIAMGESLTITPGSVPGSNARIIHAEIDVEGKQNADLGYRIDGGALNTLPIRPASDNGPDSGVNDNFPAVLDLRLTPARDLLLTPAGNSKALISVEGGGDGYIERDENTYRELFDVNGSLFVVAEVFDGLLDCGGYANVDAEGAPSSPTGPAIDGDLWRASANAKGPCEPIPYTFIIEDDNVFFDFDDGGVGASFLVKIDWRADPQLDPVRPPIREVDIDGTGFADGIKCDTVVTPPEAGALPSVGDGYSDSNGSAVCLASQTFVLTGDGWQQIQWWAVNADPRWK